MQLTSEEMSSEVIEKDQLIERIRQESAFISKILNSLQSVHQYAGDDDQSEDGDSDEEDGTNQLQAGSESRAQTVEELQQRLKDLQAKRTPKVSMKDRMLKKGYQDRLKKKKKLLLRKEQRKEKKTLVKQQEVLSKSKSDSTEKKTKPVFNSEGKMVFSKFDFSVSGANKDSKVQRGPKDPKKILEKMKSKEERLAKIAQAGNIDKVMDIKQKDAWQNALQKSEGLKVKDDPELLKKAMRKKEAQKKRSKQQWAAREKTVKKQMEERQNKRQSNIDAKKDEKKKKKQKTLIKRGRLIPGF